MRSFGRRRLLAALAGVTTLAGCGDGPAEPTQPTLDSPSPTKSPTATRTNSVTESPTVTPEPVDASDFEFVGSVVNQPGEYGPGKVRASLTNRSSEEHHLLGGHLIPVSGGIADGPNDALLLLPDEDDRINEYSWTRDGDPQGAAALGDAAHEDCWRAPGDGFLRTDLADTADLADDETVQADFYPLAAASADCPEGSYTVREELTARGTEQPLRTELTVDVDADGRLEASGSLTVGEA